MIVYFADRKLNILGQASTGLPEGLTIKDDLKTEDVESGVATFECKITFNQDTRYMVESCAEVGNYILRSHNGENEFYTIIDTEFDTGIQEVYIYAEDAGLDLLNEVVGEYSADKAYPISYYINLFAYDSGFVIGLNEIPGLTRKLSWDGEATVTERLASVATQFDGCEISYSYDIKGLSITNKYINIHKKRGKDIGVQLRLNNEIDAILTKKSIADLATALHCTGGTPEESEEPITLDGYRYDDGDFYVEGTRLYSRNALKKWSRYLAKDEPNQQTGNVGHIDKRYTYDTTNQATLCAHAVTKLKKICDVEVNYEVDISRLPDNVRIGDRVNIIDDAGELYVSSRVLQLETSVCDLKHKATLGEYLIKGNGISQKVADLAELFYKNSQSVARALALANNAKSEADASKTQADKAAIASENATAAAQEATNAANTATQASNEAKAAADAAQGEVDNVKEQVSGMETTVANAKSAAEQAQAAAATAETKATEAHTAAVKAAEDAQAAKTAAYAAQNTANAAVEQAGTAKSAADIAKSEAEAATATAEAAKLDAENAQKEIDALGDNLTTIENTMEADYARKTDLTESKASLQTQITQNAAGISSTAKKLQEIDETANNALEQLEGAYKYAAIAQEYADKAEQYAQETQAAADAAAQAAADAHAEADTAQAAADTAKTTADKAESDLAAAQAELETISSKADATEEEIAAAQAKVDTAQAVADAAKAEAESAIATAKDAQAVAETASNDASKAQAVASKALEDATTAQKVADEAKGNADEAQAVADAAKATANSAQLTADAAKAEADTAQAAADDASKEAQIALSNAIAAASKMEHAEADLAAAQQRLEEIESDAESTAEELAAAQADVAAAQAAADAAAQAASEAQTAADTAQAAADSAQAEADTARAAADAAQTEADEAYKAAADAQAVVDGLSVRMTAAETNITQNAEKIELAATKTELSETAGGIRSEMSEQSTTLTSTCESIILRALKSYTETNDFDSFKETLEAQLSLLANEITLKFSQASQDISSVNDDLQEKFNTITKYFAFDINGLTIGQVDNPYKVIIDNDRYSMTVDGTEVMWIANGKVYTPEIEITKDFRIFGYLIDQDASGNVNCGYVGGDE